MSLLDYEFNSEYDLMLSVWGEGILRESSLPDFQQPDEILKMYSDKYRKYPKSISLYIKDPMACGYDYGYVGVESAFLEKLETLKELILPPSVQDIQMTVKLESILNDNNTLIRGTFDSFAEKFAVENNLRFRHSDFVFAEYELEYAPELTQLTMQFNRDGSVIIKEDISLPGSSSSNNLGGSFYHRLTPKFYQTGTVEDVADKFSGGLRSAVIKDGRLADFIAKSKSRDLFTGYNA